MSEEGLGKLLQYEAPGPVAGEFILSRKPVSGIMGPIGSGKTGANLMGHVFRACEQRPSARDGVRRYRLCVVRDTYRQLWQSTIPSWFEWVRQDWGKFTGARDQPSSHAIRFRLGDGTRVEYMVDFIAIGEHNAEDVLRGYQVTAFYLNEVDRLAPEVFQYARGRAGRFPRMDEGGPTWWGVTCDFNAPDTDAWLYDSFFGKDKVDDFDIFVQPGGREPGAENLKNLAPGYYERQSAGQPDWYLRRMIDNLFGASRDGKPVYPEYNDVRHTAPQILEANPAEKIIVGADAGGHPAAALVQRQPDGQWRALGELCGEQGTGSHRFGDDLSRLLTERFPQHTRRDKDFEGWADPSSVYGADKKAGEENWLEIVSKKTGIRFRPAPTNKLNPRIEAARVPLVRTIDGTRPGLIVSPRCPVIRKGFNSGYRYRRIQVPGETRWSEEPEKNDHSHPMEALQYALLGGGEYAEVMLRGDRRNKRPVRAVTQEDYERDGARGPGRRGR
jgi:hypothetical protein